MAQPFAEGGGAAVTPEDLLLPVRLGPARALLEEVLLRKIAAALAPQHGVSVTDDDVDAAFADLCAENDLFEPGQVAAWLRSLGLDEVSLRDYLREKLLDDRLCPVLIPDAAVEQHFKASPYDYATLHLQTVALATRGAAAETLLQLNEGETAWEDVARRAGGLRSLVRHRRDAPAEVATELFVAPLGSFAGPVEEAADRHLIYRITWRDDPRLDGLLRDAIRHDLYREALRASFNANPLTFSP